MSFLYFSFNTAATAVSVVNVSRYDFVGEKVFFRHYHNILNGGDTLASIHLAHVVLHVTESCPHTELHYDRTALAGP